MLLSELIPRVASQVRMLAAGLALDPATLVVRHVAGPGDPATTSFSIADAHARYYLQLAEDPAGHAALRRWLDLGALLSARYHAPRIRGWLEIVDTPFAGLLFEHPDGHVVDLSRVPDLGQALGRLVGRLHADRELAARLPGPAPTCRDAYLAGHCARATATLKATRAACPPFVDTATLAYLAAELDRMTAQVRASTAFAAPADLPIHGDLHPGHVRLTDKGTFHVLGWDTLRLGDPALDLAALPPRTAVVDPGADTMQATRAIREPWLSERVALLRRVLALAEVIEPLHAWLAAAAVPEGREPGLAQLQRAHETALAAYRQDHA